MKRIVYLTIILITIILTGNSAPIPPTGYAAVTVNVTLSCSGDNTSGTIIMLDNTYEEDPSYQVTMDAQGTVTFQEVLYGNYTITVIKFGYESWGQGPVTIGGDMTINAGLIKKLSAPSNLQINDKSLLATWSPPLYSETIFTENWSGGSLTTNGWTTSGGTNWQMNQGSGNPEPSVIFFWSPQATNYNVYLTSKELAGLHSPVLKLNFDIFLDNYATTTENTMAVELWDGSMWHVLKNYSNQGGNIPWTTESLDISSYTDMTFKIRFHASGGDSFDINYWSIDNISVVASEATIYQDPCLSNYLFYLDNNVIQITTDTAFLIPNDLVAYGLTFTCCVQAMYESGNSGSYCQPFVSHFLCPPTQLTATAIGDAEYLTWQKPQCSDSPLGLIGYEIFRSQGGPAGPWNLIKQLINYPDSLSWYDYNLAAGKYCYKVTAYYDLSFFIGAAGPLDSSLPEGPQCDTLSCGNQTLFCEHWSGGSFAFNNWTFGATGQGNWIYNTGVGNPAPGADFSWAPISTNYSYSMESPAIDASQWTCATIWLDFDYKLVDRNMTSNEKMTIEVYYNNTWHQVDELVNGGNVDWTSKHYDISAVQGLSYKFRFRANGANSGNIFHWYVDNIYIYGVCLPPTSVDYSLHGCYCTLTWLPPSCGNPAASGLVGYNVYRSESLPNPAKSTFGPFVKMNAEVITGTSYVDTNFPGAEQNEIYFDFKYFVTGVFNSNFSNTFLCESSSDTIHGSFPAIGEPTVITVAPLYITKTTAIPRGHKFYSHSDIIGVTYGLSPNPTIESNSTAILFGFGLKDLFGFMTGLSSGTTYHVRAYATRPDIVTTYGNDITFTTLCPFSYSLPFIEEFPSSSLPNCWSQNDIHGNGQIWQFGAIAGNDTPPALTGNYAYLNSEGYGNGNIQNTDLVSPLFDLSHYSNVVLEFKHFFNAYSGSVGTLSYSIDNGTTWTTIQSFTETTTNPAIFSQSIAAVAGQNLVKFKWNYTGSWGYFWAIDDIQVTGVSTILTTLEPSSVTLTSAVSGGNITFDGGSPVTSRGVCWGVSENPTVAGNHTTDGAGTGVFSSNITSLTAGTIYHIRSYATNSYGTSYGNDLLCSTVCPESFSPPLYEGFSALSTPNCWTQIDHLYNVPSTWQFGQITVYGSDNPLLSGNYAFIGGAIYGNNHLDADLISPLLDLSGFSDVTLGFDHYFPSNPGGTVPNTGTLSYSTDNGSTWSVIQTFLTDTTNPAVFSLSIPEVGGWSQVKFKWNYSNFYSWSCWAIDDIRITGVVLNPFLKTTAPSYITRHTAVSGGNITNDGGAPITVRGACWGVSVNPDITGDHTNDGSGTGQFTSSITGILTGKTYHVRAYGINSSGIMYGNDIVFTTESPLPPTLITSTPYSVKDVTAISGGDITSDGGAPITARGVCWQAWGTPTISDSHSDDGPGTGTFPSALTGLKYGTTYYVRAYATNSAGTSYGNELYLTTACETVTLPFNEGFDAWAPNGHFLDCWYQNDNWGTGGIWDFKFLYEPYGEPALTGDYAVISALHSNNPQNTDLVSPLFDLSDYSAIVLSFNHHFRAYPGSSGSVAYSINNGSTWITLQTFSLTTGNPETFSQSIPSLAGQNQVRFKWNYTSSGVGWYWAVDDIQIQGVTAEISLSTLTPYPVNWSSAVSGGNLTSGGNVSITSRGVCWDVVINPFADHGNRTIDGSGGGSFVSNITGLAGNTTYHARAYVTNGGGTWYGTDISFTTSPPIPPTLTTEDLSYITRTMALTGGTITADGGASVTARGVCWDLSANPDITVSHTIDVCDGSNMFESRISDLTPATTYHVRAYATNSSGTSYGDDIPFSTECPVYSLPFNEGFATSSQPSCWSQMDNWGEGQVWQFGAITGYGANNPVLTGNYAFLNSDGYGQDYTQDADLISPMMDLTGYVTVNLSFKHFYRSLSTSAATLFYSVNNGASWNIIHTFTATTANPETFSQSIPAAAGQSQVKFKWNYSGSFAWYWAVDDIQVTGIGPALLSTATPSSITTTTAVSGGNVTSDGGAPVTARGVCWSIWPNPEVTATGSHTTDGSGTGSFTSNISGLDANTNYHVRAYATTSNGTFYGNDILFTTVKSSQQLSIPNGWSGISSHIIPANPDVEAIFSPVLSKLIITYNMTGMYYPSIPVNTIGNWDNNSGYIIKLTEASGLPIWGSEVVNKTVNLNQGWNLIPVLSQQDYNIVSLFAGVPGFAIAKEVAGSGVYWKIYGINSIGAVQPGKAYYVRMNTAGSIDYSLPADNSSSGKPVEIPALSTPWNAVMNTPASHLVAFNIQNGTFQTMDIIGGFTQESWCAGVVEITDPSVPFALNLNGDDAYSSEKDGFETGEVLNYQLYRPSTGETFNLEVTYNPEMNPGNFENNGLSEVNTVKMSATGISNPVGDDLKIYPNPAKEILIIESASTIKAVEMMNFTGQTVYTNTSVDSQTLQVDVSDFAGGVYCVKIMTDNGIRTVKVAVNK